MRACYCLLMLAPSCWPRGTGEVIPSRCVCGGHAKKGTHQSESVGGPTYKPVSIQSLAQQQATTRTMFFFLQAHVNHWKCKVCCTKSPSLNCPSWIVWAIQGRRIDIAKRVVAKVSAISGGVEIHHAEHVGHLRDPMILLPIC